MLIRQLVFPHTFSTLSFWQSFLHNIIMLITYLLFCMIPNRNGYSKECMCNVHYECHKACHQFSELGTCLSIDPFCPGPQLVPHQLDKILSPARMQKKWSKMMTFIFLTIGSSNKIHGYKTKQDLLGIVMMIMSRYKKRVMLIYWWVCLTIFLTKTRRNI